MDNLAAFQGLLQTDPVSIPLSPIIPGLISTALLLPSQPSGRGVRMQKPSPDSEPVVLKL